MHSMQNNAFFGMKMTHTKMALIKYLTVNNEIRLQITFHASRNSSKCHFSMRSMLLIFTGKASRRSITKCCFVRVPVKV